MSRTEVTLGIDIGGTNTKFGLVDRQGKCHLKTSLSTRASRPASQLFERLFEQFKELCINCSKQYDIKGIGIGAPNGNYYTGSIENPPNLKWGNVNLVELAKTHMNVPVRVTNDANAAALGEMRFGAAKGMKNFIEITLGTGLGSGIVVDGELVYGEDGFAGEMGHIIVRKNGRVCGCGRRGCLETYVSAPGICRTVYERLADHNISSILSDTPIDRLTSKMIFEAAEQGDEIALKTFEQTGQILGEALADAVAYLSPQAIIVFGGLATAGDYILNPTKTHMEKNLLQIYKNKVQVIPSGLPEGEAAILGASALIWHEINHSSS